MSKIFSLRVVRQDVQNQLGLSREIFALVAELTDLEKTITDKDTRKNLDHITGRLFDVGQRIFDNASKTGDAAVKFTSLK